MAYHVKTVDMELGKVSKGEQDILFTGNVYFKDGLSQNAILIRLQ